MKKAALLNMGSQFDPNLRVKIESAVDLSTTSHAMLERPRPNRARTIRVMIVDNQDVVRIGVAAVVNSQPDMIVVAETGNGRDAVRVYRKHQPDVTLLDLRLPEMSGLEAMQTIRRECPRSRFIVLTNCDGDEHIHRALEAGATAYLLKAVSASELLQAIRNVHAGLRWLSRPIVEALASRPPNCELTPRERQIVGLIVAGMSNREIAQAVGLTAGTVKWYVNGLLERLCVIDRTQAAITAVRRGIVDLVDLGDSRWKTTTGCVHGAA
jgi:DNA-binding NarL/FixJ family response regulator